MAEAVIVAGARTPIGKLSGALAGFSAMDLGGFAIAEALSRAGVSPDQVDYVLMGQVILAGQGQITARQAAVKGGIPMTVPANTINKVCLSGLNTIYLADQMIRSGDAEIVVAGGMESMTQAPHLLPGARAGFRIGDATLVDSMMYDGLTDSFDHIAMGLSTEQHNDKVGITRDRQDAFAAASHEKAAAAAKEGRLAEEIVPVQVPQRKGDPLLVDTDEGVRPGTTAESLGALKPAFRKDGTITAGNASQISDGGAAVVVMSAAKAKELGITPLGQLVGYGMVAGPDNSLLTQPSRAIVKAAGKAGVDVAAIDLFEINEAFAAVGLASADELGIDEDKINVNGGAIALGHPVGMSGTRVALAARCSSCAGEAPPRQLWRCAAAAVRATRRSCAVGLRRRRERGDHDGHQLCGCARHLSRAVDVEGIVETERQVGNRAAPRWRGPCCQGREEGLRRSKPAPWVVADDHAGATCSRRDRTTSRRSPARLHRGRSRAGTGAGSATPARTSSPWLPAAAGEDQRRDPLVVHLEVVEGALLPAPSKKGVRERGAPPSAQGLRTWSKSVRRGGSADSVWRGAERQGAAAPSPWSRSKPRAKARVQVRTAARRRLLPRCTMFGWSRSRSCRC